MTQMSKNERSILLNILFKLAFPVLIVFFVAGCGVGPRESFNAETSTVDMVIYFVPDATSEQVGKFDWEVLSVPTGRTPTEHTLASGVGGMASCPGPERYRAICVWFSRPYDIESRTRIRTEAESWAIVQKVLENVVPMQVTETDLLN